MKEAEDIIISKRYFELTPSELELVKELAANEEDYDAMKWFLTSTQTTFSSTQINPSANLRRNVMAHLNKQPAQKTIWLNSVATFMFPSQKKFYQMPALQMAAVAVLLIGVVLVYNRNFKEQDTLALNTTTVEKPHSAVDNNLNETRLDFDSAQESIEEKVKLERLEDGETSIQQPLVDRKKSGDLEIGSEAFAAKDLSVAEEVKLNWYKPNEQDLRNDLGKNTPVTGASGTTTTIIESSDEVVTLSSTIQKDSDKDSKNKKAENSKSQNTKDDISVNQSPAMLDDNIALEEKKESEDSGTYKTAIAGGVYRESIGANSRNEVTGKSDAETPQPHYSITQSKELKALFGTFK